jgi:hypothetical protein
LLLLLLLLLLLVLLGLLLDSLKPLHLWSGWCDVLQVQQLILRCSQTAAQITQ